MNGEIAVSDVPLTLQIGEKERELALSECFDQLQRWSIPLPPSEPLLIDFGLGNFRKIGLFEFWIANEVEAGYCGKYMFVYDKQMCPRHYHRVKHETFFVVRGGLDVGLEDESLVLQEGQTLAIEPGRVHSFAGIGPSLMLELSMPCDPLDNYFEAPETMNWLHRNLQGHNGESPTGRGS